VAIWVAEKGAVEHTRHPLARLAILGRAKLKGALLAGKTSLSRDFTLGLLKSGQADGVKRFDIVINYLY